MYKQYLTLSLTGLLLQASGVLGLQLRPPAHPLQRRADGTIDNPNPYPGCNPKKDEFCIENGKYLLPPLPVQSPGDEGDSAFMRYLDTKKFELSEWTGDLMPAECQAYIEHDGFNEADFTMYNVTYTDCSTPFVLCHSKNSGKTPSQIAVEISRIPITMRQSTSMFLVYGDMLTDRPEHTRHIAASCEHGLVVGRPEGFFITALVHEVAHSMDCTLVSPDAEPGSFGTDFTSTSTWQDAVDKDGFAVSHYGTTSYVENYADAARLVLLDNIYPKGLKAFVGNHPNMTQIKNQLDVIKKSDGGKLYDYNKDDKCDSKLKFAYPTNLVQVKRAAKTTTTADVPEPSKTPGADETNTGAANQGTDGTAKPEEKDSAGAGRARPFAFFPFFM